MSCRGRGMNRPAAMLFPTVLMAITVGAAILSGDVAWLETTMNENAEKKSTAPSSAPPKAMPLSYQPAVESSGASDLFSAIAIFCICVLATPLLMFVCVLMAGGGHGTYLPADVLFPYSMLFVKLITRSITKPAMIGAAVQFPLYGIILIAAVMAGKQRWTLKILLLIHVLAVLWCMTCGEF